MAATFTFAPDTEGREVVGRDREITGTLTIAGTYTTGGDAMAADEAAFARMFGLARLDDIIFLEGVTSAGAFPRLIRSTRVLRQHGGAAAGAVVGELTAATAVAGTIRVTARGK